MIKKLADLLHYIVNIPKSKPKPKPDPRSHRRG